MLYLFFSITCIQHTFSVDLRLVLVNFLSFNCQLNSFLSIPLSLSSSFFFSVLTFLHYSTLSLCLSLTLTLSPPLVFITHHQPPSIISFSLLLSSHVVLLLIDLFLVLPSFPALSLSLFLPFSIFFFPIHFLLSLSLTHLRSHCTSSLQYGPYLYLYF